MSTGCLNIEDRQRYEAGQLPRIDAERFSYHMKYCPKCGSSSAEYITDDLLLGSLRQAANLVGVNQPSSIPTYRPGTIVSPTFPEQIEGYQILRELQRGGQGVVYEAIQLATKRKVAVKVLLEEPFGDPTHRRRRFESEIELVSQIQHPNIV